MLVLSTTFPAKKGDGTPEFVLTLAAELARGGRDVLVLAPRIPGSVRHEIIDGVEVQRFRYFPHRWERLADGAIVANLRARPADAVQIIPLLVAFTLASLKITRRFRPNVIHAHWIVPSGVIARLLRLITRTPYIVTVHGADAYTLESRSVRWLKRAVLRGAAATVPVSGDIAKLLRQVGDVRPPVPMGVDVERIRTEVGPRQPIPGRVLFVGRLVDKKGADVLLRAAAELPTADVVIAGGGPLEADLRALAADLAISDRVTMLGSVPRAAVMAELSRAAVLAMPSQVGAGGDQDGVPVVLGEALAAGVPVVASRLGGLGEYLHDGATARLVSPGSPTELAAALAELIDDPEAAAALAARATGDVLPQLSLERTARSYADLLAEVAAS